MSATRRSTRRSTLPTALVGAPSLPPGFTDEVMRAIGRAPRPSPARSFRSAIRARSIAEAGAALSVASRIVRRKTSMPLMVRAQALALLAIVAGSIVGGGALAGVVAYQAVVPIVQTISEPVGDRAPTRHDEIVPAPPPAPLESTPDAPVAVAPPGDATSGGPDRPPTRTATKVGADAGGDGEAGADELDDPADGDDPAEADEHEGDGGPATAEAAEPTEQAEESDPADAAGAEQPSDGEGPEQSDHGNGPDGG